MWMSVPQIAVFLTRIFTSLGPTSGTSTSSIQMPTSAFAFTSAFIFIRASDPSARPVVFHVAESRRRGECGRAERTATAIHGARVRAHTTPSERPTRANASMARSIWAGVCAADICVRMRAWSLGTTG